MDKSEQLEVSQADRDAAANIWRDYVARVGECIAEKAIREGASDCTMIVQAFARHRQATEARMAAAVEAERERILVIVADQKKAANESDKWPKYHGMAGSYMQGAYVNACANIEAAIRSADDGQG